MLNLLGCSKDNFIKLIKKMNYKTLKKIINYILNIFPKKEKKNKKKIINK